MAVIFNAKPKFVRCLWACARRVLPRLPVLASCALLMAATVKGAQPADPFSAAALKRMSVEELLSLPVLSLSRQPEALGRAPGSVFLMSDRAAVATGATTLPHLLRLAPNLFVAQHSASHWAINARGFVRTNGYSNKLLVLVDGRTAYSPLFSNVFWDSTDVFVPDLQNVEVISGPAGAMWGANAVNGVINIQSKSAHETLGGLVLLGTGGEKYHASVRYGAPLGRTGAVRVYAKKIQHEATRSATGAEDDYDRWDRFQAGFRADWELGLDTTLTVQGDVYRGNFHFGAADPVLSDGANLLARWTRRFSPDSSLWIRAYHDYSTRNTSNLLTETTRTTDLEFQHRFVFGDRQEFLWGGNYRRIADRVSDTVGFALLPADLRFGLGSVFAQHQVGFANDTLRLISGFRLENNHFSGWESQPSLRLAWHPLPRHTFWTAASRATRIPSRLDVGFFAPVEPPHFVIGGPNFQSEILHAYELGWRGLPANNLSFTATIFYHDYDRLRSTELTTPAQVGNGVEGRSYGLELFMDWDVATWWRMRVGGFRTEQETWLKPGSLDAEQGMGEVSFPSWQATFRNSFTLSRSWMIWSALRHVAEVPTFEGVPGSVPAYTELDLRLAWQIRPELELSVLGRNLLQPSHPEIGSVATRREIERNVQFLLRWAF